MKETKVHLVEINLEVETIKIGFLKSPISSIYLLPRKPASKRNDAYIGKGCNHR